MTAEDSFLGQPSNCRFDERKTMFRKDLFTRLILVMAVFAAGAIATAMSGDEPSRYRCTSTQSCPQTGQMYSGSGMGYSTDEALSAATSAASHSCESSCSTSCSSESSSCE